MQSGEGSKDRYMGVWWDGFSGVAGSPIYGATVVALFEPCV